MILKSCLDGSAGFEEGPHYGQRCLLWACWFADLLTISFIEFSGQGLARADKAVRRTMKTWIDVAATGNK